MKEAGVIVVEVDDLAKCEFVRASEVLSGDDMFFAALRALNTSEGFSEGRKQRDVFVKTLLELTEAARQKAEPSA